MANPLESRNLLYLLSQFESILNIRNEEGKAPAEKELLENRLLNVMMVGLNDLNDHQLQELALFRGRILPLHPDERVVKVIDIVLTLTAVAGLPFELQIAICLKGDSSNFIKESDELKQAVLNEAVAIIIERSHSEGVVDPQIARHAEKVLLGLEKGLEIFRADELFTSLHRLIEKVSESKAHSPDIQVFVNIAEAIAIKLKGDEVPEDIANHRAYRGEARNLGAAKIAELLSKGELQNESVRTIVCEYCDELLKPGEYIIRVSSIGQNQLPNYRKAADGDFLFTVSYKKEDKIIKHTRAVRRRTEEGEVEWRWCREDGTLRENAYRTLSQLIGANANIRGLTPHVGMEWEQADLSFARSIAIEGPKKELKEDPLTQALLTRQPGQEERVDSHLPPLERGDFDGETVFEGGGLNDSEWPWETPLEDPSLPLLSSSGKETLLGNGRLSGSEWPWSLIALTPSPQGDEERLANSRGLTFTDKSWLFKGRGK